MGFFCVGPPCAASTLLWSDNFGVPDSSLTESGQANRNEGRFASLISLNNAKYIMHIRDQRLELTGRSQEGRLRFHDADQPGARLDFASGDIGATIRREGGLRVDFDWFPPHQGSALDDWIALSAGIPAAVTAEPAVRVDHPSTDIGLKLRFDGRIKAYDNGLVTGSTTPYRAAGNGSKHVSVEYHFQSNAENAPVLMTAWVNDQLVHRGLYTWQGDGGQLHLEVGAKAPSRIDNLRLSTVPEGPSLVFAGFVAMACLRRRSHLKCGGRMSYSH
jgi:hypothetical protein